MEKVTPTPRTFTLKFKHHRTTILIEVDPIQKLSEVRAELLSAIQDTNPSGQLNGHTIPKNPDDILLGRAVDRNHLNLGFESIDKDADENLASGKGKGKSTASKSLTATLKDSPQGAGLKNADTVAFKFRQEDEEEDEGAQKWDVVIPTLEDTYGEDDAQDEGIGMED